MKKLNAILLSSLILSGTLFASKINAQENYYQTYTKQIQKTHTEEIISPEVEKDLNSLKDLKYLKLKTNSNYEVALANSDGTYSYLSSCDELQTAVEEANAQVHKVKNDTVPVVINSEGIVVYATEGIGRVIRLVGGVPTTDINTTTNIYRTSELKSPEFTYINHFYIDDVPILESDGVSSKIEVSGYTGYIKNTEEDGSTNLIVVPINQANGLSFYDVNSAGELVHYISSDVTTADKISPQVLGPTPSYIKPGVKYYSYDGNYFYTDIKELINDVKANHHNNAVNASTPYYNYYQYLPGRSKTSYTAEELNGYFEKNTPVDSVLRNSGRYFIKAQDGYGVNAITSIGIAMNESARGTSILAKTKNNIFGDNAKDAFPQGATSFASIEECIMRVGNYSLSNGYFNPKSWKYNGSTVGNKSIGANIRYASDPYWGEKAARNMYDIDKYLSEGSGLKDYNRYTLGIYTSPTTVKNISNKDLYSILSAGSRLPYQPAQGQVGDSTIILGNSGTNYEIRPDRIVSINETNLNGDGTYLWDRYGIVAQNKIKVINQESDPSTDFSNNWAKGYIIYAMNKGWIDTTNTFRPTESITRASFVKIINRAFDLTDKGNIDFSDVVQDSWYYDDVRIAVKAGYINGDGEGRFRPDDPITRQEVAKILTTINKKIDYNVDKIYKFNDYYAVDNWAINYMEGAVEVGYINGKDGNLLDPKGLTTRAEAVKMIYMAT